MKKLTTEPIHSCGYEIKMNTDLTYSMKSEKTKERCDVDPKKNLQKYIGKCKDCDRIYKDCIGSKPDVDLGPPTPMIEKEEIVGP